MAGPATVHLTVSASDEGSGVSESLGGDFVLDGSGGDVFVRVTAYRTSCNQFNGSYSGEITFPQGMPPGFYRLRIFASDTRHFIAYRTSQTRP